MCRVTKRKRPFGIVYRPDTVRHLAAIDPKYKSLIKRTIGEQLSHEPFYETTNRKPLLKQSPLGEEVWEIRLGPENRFRVFYAVVPDAPRRVIVEAIGVKKRNRIAIGRQEVKYES